MEENILLLREMQYNCINQSEYIDPKCMQKAKAIEKILNELESLQEENEELRKGQKSLMQSRKKWKDRYYKLREKNRKIIDLMAQNIELQQFANIDITNLDLICKRLHCNKKCRLVSKECIKKYFTRIIRR